MLKFCMHDAYCNRLISYITNEVIAAADQLGGVLGQASPAQQTGWLAALLSLCARAESPERAYASFIDATS